MDFSFNFLPILNAVTLQAQAAAQAGAADPHPGAHSGWQVIVVTFLSSILAQFVKVLGKLFKTGKLDLRLIARTGGMPSSHSSCTMGMATTVGFIEGFNSVSFAIALCLAAIVMYDAAGVRRTVGLQAQVLNKMIEELFSEHPHISSERIKEFLGHTPKEVLVGALFGVAIAYTFHYCVIQRL
jgi:acid phosphatase family membrane protein YuiD